MVCEVAMVLPQLTVDTQFIMLSLADYLEQKFSRQCVVGSKPFLPDIKAKEKPEKTARVRKKWPQVTLYDRTGMLQSCFSL